LNENGIRQVLLNLITNAVQAMPEGGELRIATALVDPDRVRVSVRDTGVGIPQDRLASIFNPFYTTKEPGEGTGLGLSVVHSVVKNTGGSIDVKSEPGKGTTFVLELPIDHPDAELDLSLLARGAGRLSESV
jgi:two-component system NtrC family sensor kinase